LRKNAYMVLVQSLGQRMWFTVPATKPGRLPR